MGVKKLEDLVAFQLAVSFKREVYRVVRNSSQANSDLRYKQQLFDAALSVEANVAEGWQRFKAAEFAQFLRYAIASLAEARRRLADSVDRGYCSEVDCREALVLGNRCAAALSNLHKSLREFTEKPKRG